MLLIALVLTIGVAGEIRPSEARSHVGQTATICGVVDDARYASGSRRQPTFLNFGGKYPNHQFTAVIFGPDRAKFATAPEVAYLGKRTCVTGPVTLYREKPQIVVTESRQVVLER